MSVNYQNMSAQLFNSEVDKIPEPYRTEFIKFVQVSQEKLENQTYSGDAGAGLLTIVIDSKGGIKKLNIDQRLFDKDADWVKTNELISNLSCIAHSNALQTAKKAVDEELEKLYSKILLMAEKITKSEKS